MLEQYLREHPDEVFVLQDDAGPTESSDDGNVAPGTFLRDGTSLELGERLLMSTPALSQSGNVLFTCCSHVPVG